LIEVVDRLQRFTGRIDFSTFERAQGELDAAQAFVDAGEAERRASTCSCRRPGASTSGGSSRWNWRPR